MFFAGCETPHTRPHKNLINVDERCTFRLLRDESMTERTTTQVFGLAMAAVFAGVLLLNAIS